MFDQQIYDLRPWYHDFAGLGLQTRFDDRQAGLGSRLVQAIRMLLTLRPRQMLGTRLEKRELLSLLQMLGKSGPGHFANQPQKERVLVPYLTQCLGDLAGRPTCLDLFCADGYYACMMAGLHSGAEITGIDLAAMEIRRARAAARLLHLDSVQFVVANAWEVLLQPRRYDLVLCAGGLYHLEEPERFIGLLRPITSRYLLIQSVVTLESDDPEFFVTPAPGLRHGSRFTHAALERWLLQAGWEIVEQARNELPGNKLDRDRGSSYFLCRPAARDRLRSNGT